MGRTFVLLIVCLAVFPATRVEAQDTAATGLITGSVVDSAGAPAPDVAVCLPETGRCEVTGPRGAFRLAEVRAGRYRLEIPNLNTFANFASACGTVSILDAQLIQDVTFLTGGFPAAYGNRTSSVLPIAQREGSRERLAGRVTLGFAGAGGIVEGSLGRTGRGSWIVSARRSFLDLFSDDVGIGGVPVLYTVSSPTSAIRSPCATSCSRWPAKARARRAASRSPAS